VTGYEDGRSDAVKAIRKLQPDHPADAGEPPCCARTREDNSDGR
jgi:hypothetical protein